MSWITAVSSTSSRAAISSKPPCFLSSQPVCWSTLYMALGQTQCASFVCFQGPWSSSLLALIPAPSQPLYFIASSIYLNLSSFFTCDRNLTRFWPSRLTSPS
ncbi:hypothetical protein ASPBRDRAFT_343713 [Aspergillus brasiliensis CBS 101740]|uniref:Uncharacterized protein n=1 Tax=Aspergillus brasiliensis (strain CBS 101740 / IMI 381727 / IBT 21946) TaxID=767769 RepID=A0A1L9U728_ASPBC|nr:hypothetical protein ASPBRDRAFT_343713 [Aspergillus brasiliensis CBS 101740]